MAIDGSWKLSINSPLGALESELEVASNGGTLSGVQRGAGDERTIYDGTVDGDAVTWSVDISQPLPANLTFNGTVNGDRLEGQVRAGAFGSFPFTGERSA